MTTQGPSWVAHRLVALAARTLPAAQRERYRREFEADLYVIPPGDQIRYATQVLTRAWSLRAALTEPALETTGEGTMKTIPTHPLSCRLHLRHHWRRFFTEDGARFTACTKCGKEQPNSVYGTNVAPDRWFS